MVWVALMAAVSEQLSLAHLHYQKQNRVRVDSSILVGVARQRIVQCGQASQRRVNRGMGGVVGIVFSRLHRGGEELGNHRARGFRYDIHLSLLVSIVEQSAICSRR
jgi:hypothetical protein